MNVTRIEDMRNEEYILVGELERKNLFVRPSLECEGNMKMDVREIIYFTVKIM
jgi:hypothetical protein